MSEEKQAGLLAGVEWEDDLNPSSPE